MHCWGGRAGVVGTVVVCSIVVVVVGEVHIVVVVVFVGSKVVSVLGCIAGSSYSDRLGFWSGNVTCEVVGSCSGLTVELGTADVIGPWQGCGGRVAWFWVGLVGVHAAAVQGQGRYVLEVGWSGLENLGWQNGEDFERCRTGFVCVETGCSVAAERFWQSGQVCSDQMAGRLVASRCLGLGWRRKSALRRRVGSTVAIARNVQLRLWLLRGRRCPQQCKVTVRLRHGLVGREIWLVWVCEVAAGTQ